MVLVFMKYLVMLFVLDGMGEWLCVCVCCVCVCVCVC
jgi:hypothetical protein